MQLSVDIRILYWYVCIQAVAKVRYGAQPFGVCPTYIACLTKAISVDRKFIEQVLRPDKFILFFRKLQKLVQKKRMQA